MMPMMFKTWLPLAGVMLFVAESACAENQTRVFKMGLLTPWHLGYDFSGYTSASAITVAMDKIHADPQLNANGRIKLRYVDCTMSLSSSSGAGTVRYAVSLQNIVIYLFNCSYHYAAVFSC